MDERSNNLDTTPDCWCEVGKMVLKEAGPKSRNWNRLYYKCPMNRNDHPRHFIWVDEYRQLIHTNRGRASTVDMACNNGSRVTQTASSLTNPKLTASASQSRTCPAISANEPQFIASFMCAVLVMLGVIIGLLLAKMI